MSNKRYHLSADVGSGSLPAVIFGTSSLGNLYEELAYPTKLEIVRSSIAASKQLPVFDTAGKYGAGLALETLAKCLRDLNVQPQEVTICNKLGWYRIPLKTPEPTFEPGVWKNLKYDAIQTIGYDGILKCFEQGNQLLGDYNARMVSVHDPDEYLLGGNTKGDYWKRYQDIIDAYTALGELKSSGRVTSVGIGAKDWQVIRKLSEEVNLDWVMIANSLTVKSHPRELINYIGLLREKGIKVINSAVFNGGFLTGGNFYNYREVDPLTAYGQELLGWRVRFFKICNEFGVLPAEACFNFSFQFPGIESIAMNTTRPEKVAGNVALGNKKMPDGFWEHMQAEGLIETLKQS